MNIIITGASRGIGKEVALNLASRGDHRILLISRNEDRLKEVCTEAGSTCQISYIPFDLEKGDLQDLKEKVRKDFSEIDVLINNAGALINKKFGHLSADEFDHMMNINVKAPFLLSQELLPYFETGSHIVNISSMGGFQGSAKFSGLSAYSASKGALAILSECMAEELKDHHIAVNCLALGAARTEMLSEAFPGYMAPLSAAEMGSYIADFALTGHKYYNGKILPVSLSTP